MWKNIVERGRSQMTIWRMRISSWITNVPNTHSEYKTLLLFHSNNFRTNAPRRYVIHIRTLRVLLPCEWNILLKCTQQIEVHNTGVHVMAKAAQTTNLHRALGCKYFRSAELILLLLDHVTIEIRRCLKNYFPCRRQFPAPPTESPLPIKRSTLSTPTESNSQSDATQFT
jgi:hypothetical protein